MNLWKRKHGLWRQARWACVSVAAFSPAAFAQDCPPPTLEQCTNADYRAGACGIDNDAVCQGQVERAWSERWDAAPKQVRQLPDELGGRVESIAVESNIPVDTHFEGMRGTLAGQVLLGQVLNRKHFENLSDDEQAYQRTLESWDANGTQITSCQEFVHEAYLDFSRFEARTGEFGDDFRAIFNAANGEGGIAGRTLYDSGEKPLDPIWGPSAVAKNSYFRFVPGGYPDGTEPYAFTSAAARLANNPRASSWVVPSDAWNLQMSRALGKTPDVTLDALQAEQESFEELLAQRTDAFSRWETAAKAMAAKDLDTSELNKSTANSLRDLDAQLEGALEQAQEKGCLDAKSSTRCDWSPRRYQKMVSEAMNVRREKELQDCLFLTGNDFGDKSFVRNANELRIKGLDRSDYTTDVSSMRDYIGHRRDALGDDPVPTDPSTGMRRHGGSRSDTGSAGDATFGGGYDYNAGWEIIDAGTGHWCDLNARVFGQANLYANVFTPARFEVVHLNGEAVTEVSAVHVRLGARLAGVSVYSFDNSYPLHFTFAHAQTLVQSNILQASATFMVWYVPVTVSAGVSASVGVDMDIGGQLTRDCTRDVIGLDVIGHISPYGKVDAFASVGVGFSGFQVAIRGMLAITHINLPLQADLGVYLTSPVNPTHPNTLMLHLHSKLDLTQRHLDGRISLYAEAGKLSAEFPLASWAGFGGSVNLFDETLMLPVVQLF